MLFTPNEQKDEPYKQEDPKSLTFEHVSELQKSQSSLSENNILENCYRMSQEIK
jgi:hypothetical protein